MNGNVSTHHSKSMTSEPQQFCPLHRFKPFFYVVENSSVAEQPSVMVFSKVCDILLIRLLYVVPNHLTKRVASTLIELSKKLVDGECNYISKEPIYLGSNRATTDAARVIFSETSIIFGV